MKYAYITGGAGLIGSHICHYLLNERIVDKVVVLDHFGRYVESLSSTFYDYRKFRFKGIEDQIIVERSDGTVSGIIHRTLSKYKPDYIFHLAALPLAKLPNLNAIEAQQGSVQTTTNILEAISDIRTKDYAGPKRSVYASSSMTYGNFLSEVATEDHPQNPLEIYGTMKLAGEVVTKGLCKFLKIPYSIVRPSAVYGPTDMNRRVTQIFLEKALLGQTLNVEGKDEPLDFSYVKDVARGFVLTAINDGGINEIFNITHGKAHTLLEFVECLKKYIPNLKYAIRERDAFRPIRGTLSTEKAEKLIGYKSEYSLDNGVKEYLDFVRENNPFLIK